MRFDRSDYEPGLAIVEELYYRVTGTSFSAPQVSGLASLVMSTRPEIDLQSLREVLKGSAVDVGFPGVDQHTGVGVINVARALKTPSDFRLTALISGVSLAQTGDRYFVEVAGTATANRFRRARLEIGEGKAPSRWREVNQLNKPVSQGMLGRIDANELRGVPVWTLKLITEHRNGTTREVRFELTLGG